MIENIKLKQYLNNLINRVFKILPMNEEKCETLDDYVDGLVRELIGNSKMISGDDLLKIVGTLKGMDFKSREKIKSDVFKTINTIEYVVKKVGG